uniref:Uricase n=1 Tax=Nothoprocta perdicaria TaxID=30464 RepID=A0A8C6YPG7_NOTPE
MAHLKDNSSLLPHNSLDGSTASHTALCSSSLFPLWNWPDISIHTGRVAYVKTYIQEVPWQRLQENGIPHIHSFICVPEGIRFCEAEQCKNGPLVVFAGIKDLKLMKTTQSGFEGFHKSECTTLPERNDRILCGELFCKWSYGECKDFDFDCVWNKVRECVIEAFAGPPDCGVYSPSYQKTVNSIQMLILSRVSQVSSFLL